MADKKNKKKKKDRKATSATATAQTPHDKAAGKAAGILAPAEAAARRYAQWGFDFIAVGIDISLLRQAAMETVSRYKG